MKKELDLEAVARAVKTDEDNQCIWWRDGGMDVKIDGTWHCRFTNEDYVEVDLSRSRWLDMIKKKDVSVRTERTS